MTSENGIYHIFDISGKSAIVTGASSGIGKEIAIGLSKAGCSVMFVARNEPNLIRATEEADSSTASFLAVDVTKPDDVRMMTDIAIKRYGKIDMLYNCAGSTFRLPLENVPDKQFENVLRNNAYSCFLTTKYVGKEMMKRRKGHIINIGSVAGTKVIPGSSAYCASKAAMIMLTKSAAVEWAQYGIRVNIIMPGSINTPLFQSCIDKDPDYKTKMLAKHPIGRFGDPSELIGLSIYLACDNSDFLTGSVIYVDGGLSSL